MLDKFIAVLFLRNSNYERYNSMLVEYRKDFANKCNKYPADLQAMMDVMRQVPIKKKKPAPKTPTKPTEKDKEVLATSLSQKKEGDDKDGPACFICGDPKCRVWRCEKKGKLDPKDWHNPEKAKEYVKDNHTQQVEFNEEVIEVFGGLQLSDGKGKEILDSRSTITLCTNKNDMKNVRNGPKIVMVTNNGRSKINKEGEWKEWGRSYLHPPGKTDVVSISDAVVKGYQVLFNSDVENCFYVKDKKLGKVIRFPC